MAEQTLVAPVVFTSAGRILSELPTGREHPLTDPRDVIEPQFCSNDWHLTSAVQRAARERDPRPLFLAPPSWEADDDR